MTRSINPLLNQVSFEADEAGWLMRSVDDACSYRVLQAQLGSHVKMHSGCTYTNIPKLSDCQRERAAKLRLDENWGKYTAVKAGLSCWLREVTGTGITDDDVPQEIIDRARWLRKQTQTYQSHIRINTVLSNP